MCFAIGLGPIPFIYVAECFRQDARSAALAICMFVNWLANTILTITFPYLAALLTDYVFIVFTVIVAITVIVIIKKVTAKCDYDVYKKGEAYLFCSILGA